MRFFYFLILAIGLNFYAEAQEENGVIDSLSHELKAISLASKKKVDVLNSLGYYFWIVDSNKSLHYGKEALEISQKLDYVGGRAKAQRVLGVAYWTLGDARSALENLTASQENYRTINDKEGEANALMNTGMVYADIKDYESALDIYDRSIQKFSELGLRRRIATTFTKIGDVYFNQNNLENAKDYLTNALKMHTEEKYIYGIAEAHNHLGKVLLEQGELEQADYHLRKAADLGEKVNDEDGYIGNLIHRGKLQRLRKAYEDSENYLKEALLLAQNKKLRKYMLAAYLELKFLKKEQGDFKTSLNYYDAYTKLKDSIYNNDKSKRIAALEFSKELVDKEKQIAVLKEKERTNTIIKWSLGIGALCLCIIGFLVFRNQRQQNIKNQDVSKSKEALAKIALENATLKQKELQRELTFKNKELTAYTLNFVQKNELIHQLKDKIKHTKNASDDNRTRLLGELQRDIAQHSNIDRDWEDFKRFFEGVHTNFYGMLLEKHPGLSPNDLKICSLIRMNLSIKETANILGISSDSAKTARYRLRKKLGLGPEHELLSYFLELEKKASSV